MGSPTFVFTSSGTTTTTTTSSSSSSSSSSTTTTHTSTPERRFLGKSRRSLHYSHSRRSNRSLCNSSSNSVRSLPLATVDETESSSSASHNPLNAGALDQQPRHRIKGDDDPALPARRFEPDAPPPKRHQSIKMMLSTSLRNLYSLHAGHNPNKRHHGRHQEEHLHQPPQEEQGKAAGSNNSSSNNSSSSSSRRTVMMVDDSGVTPPASPHPSPHPPARPTVHVHPQQPDSIPTTSTSAGMVRPQRFRLSKDRAMPSIPQLGIFHSNHVLVNKERAQYRLPPYKRCRELDDLARIHAKAMADQSSVYHSVTSIDALRLKLHATHVAENVQCGESIRSMHDHVMAERAVSCHNLLGHFDEFGMATAKGTDGKLYLCQLFRR